jgi:ribosomal protein S6--L-glutamate ligase
MPDSSDSPLVVGWREWVALPDLGVPALRAKVDTGARTSALHATDVTVLDAAPTGDEAPGEALGSETPGAAPRRRVRFHVHPLRDRPDLVIACEAPVVDERTVRSSNGQAQTRLVIRTTLALGGRTWPIEVTLARRHRMTHRMLLGRTALAAGPCRVDPAVAYCTGRALATAYRKREP